MTSVASTVASPLPFGGAAAPASHGFLDGFFNREDGGFSFHDLLSVVNPLQHIPIVSTLYRAITGDTIKPLARVAGDTLYGGWMGCVSSVANIVFEKETGKDFGDTVLAFLEGKEGANSATDTTSNAGGSLSPQSAVQVVPIAPPAVRPSQLATAQAPIAQPVTPAVQTAVQPAQHAAPAVRTKPQPVLPSAPIATRAPALLQSSLPTDDQASASLASSMAGANVDPQIAQRALFAYRRSLSGGDAASRNIGPAL